MKLTVEKSIILKELAEVAKYRNKEQNYYLLEANENGITVKTTNNTTFYSNILPLQIVGEEDLETVHEVYEPGAVVVTSKFDEILRKAPGKTVDLMVKDNLITISTTGFKASIPAVLEALPDLPNGEETLLIDSSFEFFDKVVKHTGFAASTSEARPILTGIHLFGDGENLTATATDSHRLSRLSIKSKISFEPVIIPAKAFSDVLTSFLPDEKVRLSKLDSHVKLQQGDKVSFVTLLDGNYPDVSTLINVPESIEFTVKSKDFIGAIDRAMIFARNKTSAKNPIVRLEQSEGLLRVFASNEDGNIDSEIGFTSQTAALPTFYALNGQYLTEAIKACATEEVTFHIVDNNQRPVFIKNPNSDLIQLIVPIKVAN